MVGDTEVAFSCTPLARLVSAANLYLLHRIFGAEFGDDFGGGLAGVVGLNLSGVTP